MSEATNQRFLTGFENWWKCPNRKPLPDDEFEAFKVVWEAAIRWALEGFDSEIYPSINKGVEDKNSDWKMKNGDVL